MPGEEGGGAGHAWRRESILLRRSAGNARSPRLEGRRPHGSGPGPSRGPRGPR